MYRYDAYDQRILQERVAQFRGQTQRYLAGELSTDEFRPLRLQNGLYVQRLAPMLRIAVPYGLLSSRQLRRLAHITRHYDKGFAHVTTRQNIQLNWPLLEEVPDILAELAEVEMHAIQTSGNCIRNITADQFSGVAADEVEDARPWCELLRQWSTFHPEFAYLPRKFKIAVSGSQEDRAAVYVHDIGLIMKRDASGETGFEVLVGGGLGRTPVIAERIREFLPARHVTTYCDAIVRVYNRFGRRDNKFKARIKILVRAMGIDAFREAVEAEWEFLQNGPDTLSDAAIAQAKAAFLPPPYERIDPLAAQAALDAQRRQDAAFARWLDHNTHPHRQPGYAIVTLSLKPTGLPPGDVSDSQLDALADLADAYSFGELRTTHKQNAVLADVRKADLLQLWQRLQVLGFATPNIDHLTDIICCPGGDYCSLANAKSIPVAEAIQRRFDDIDYVYDLGAIDLNISGCMNACGHHHVGHIGILGVDKKGEEFYQVSLGGCAGSTTELGQILGPSFSQDEIAEVVATILAVYVERRHADETFLACFRRIGIGPFKERVYA